MLYLFQDRCKWITKWIDITNVALKWMKNIKRQKYFPYRERDHALKQNKGIKFKRLFYWRLLEFPKKEFYLSTFLKSKPFSGSSQDFIEALLQLLFFMEKKCFSSRCSRFCCCYDPTSPQLAKNEEWPWLDPHATWRSRKWTHASYDVYINAQSRIFL